ncbi:SIP domain-containing protein [Georgenia sp. Z1491]|uniref:SIP domain-containing protein n=1 Tax=Georgenia sp. Z1491 TaxID=3416707 RepID=UPI003CFBBA10
MCLCDAGPSPHVLLVGEHDDIPYIRSVLARLPENAYGQVYLEVDTDEHLPDVVAPERIGIRWLTRADVGDEGHLLLPKGARLERAVRAWLSEWLCDAPDEGPIVVWVGGSDNPRLAELHLELHARIHQHHHRQGARSATDRARPGHRPPEA